MTKKRKKISKNEFRYNKNTKHINYIFEEDDDKYHAVGITSKKRTKDNKGFWRKNMSLKKGLNKNEPDKKSFIRYGYITDRKNSFSRHLYDNFVFDDIDDFRNVKSKIRKYKKNNKHYLIGYFPG